MDIVISWGEKYLGQLFVREGRGVTIVKLGEIGGVCKGVVWGGGVVNIVWGRAGERPGQGAGG